MWNKFISTDQKDYILLKIQHPRKAMIYTQTWKNGRKDNDVVPLGIEELFDITPIYGELEPEQSQPISFVFFGHADVEGNVEALCEVDGGPTYSVELSGGASEIEYDLDRTEILYEPVRYDKPAVSQINLLNTGQVSFEFIVFPEESCSEEPNEELSDAPNPSDIITGQLTVEPASGCLSAGELCQINVTYLARKPCTFERVIKLQVAHFEPRRIILRGVADFPRLMMDLPRYYSSTKRKYIDRTPGENSDPSQPMPVDAPVFEHVMSQLISNLHLYVTQQLQKSKAQHVPRAVCSCRLRKLKMRAENEGTFRKPRTIENRNDLDPLFLHLPSCLVAKIVHKALINSLDLMTSIPVTLLENIPDIGLQMEAERYHLCDLLEGRFALEEQGKISGRTKKDGGSTSDVVCTNISPRQPRSGISTK
ncbi:Hydrocephalus-inducing protein [Fasciola gigantica]|uniref:Hydrocephalus-inducing protein n=1 Tax=Fasciola gigantica TaxID=46835 RepID=A0A504Y970_FASGI|nr:Hydrocephalus-inducing protein [Fasciola gigantica]